MKLYHYVYKITNTINGKFYIGKHSTDNLDDGYTGSGFALKKAIKIYGKNKFKKEILGFFDTSGDAYHEEYLLTDGLSNNILSYNMARGGMGGGEFSDESAARVLIPKLSNILRR
ncbi:hypothetical protein LCGC14_2411740 [marine sediment metagenome]|uniref:GIY-YIG domain-containing protein n=1 Tax=marine sediment metagenome TaxID=412755 RepID=A0A0F9ELS8_9ZZZZ